MKPTKQSIIFRYADIRESGLSKHHLTSSDYYILSECLQKLFAGEQVNTFCKGVADWCKRAGLQVKENGINYQIIF